MRAVSKQKQQRIEEKGREVDFLFSVYESSDKICQMCGEKLHSFNPSMCAHVLPKGRYEKYRYDANNIIVVCPRYKPLKDCHSDVDTLAAWWSHVIDLLLQKWVQITPKVLQNVNELSIEELEVLYDVVI